MDPNKSPNEPPTNWNTSEKSGITQPAPPPYQQGYPNAGYPPPGSYPNPSGYPTMQYEAPGGQPIPQVQYGHAPYPGQPPITIQPTVYMTPTPLAKPLPDYLGYSIFTLLCCCFPLGIAALIYSIFTRNANVSGQQEIAEKNSRMARILNHTALGIGLAIFVLYIIYIIVMTVYFKQHTSP
ncbi:synapse differentiation-inducing gene protein 1-like [Triplophysa rosa]|uniref:Interferon-induced transmembrane protein 3 n=1 Tax=Triplophysa rosa TaxID=992332 RepID=A0A9W7WRH6_TRIRA|nr:synapse differentiation-inducing gene protein 1-like [Triplophysa rosa]KAI7806926.1 putative interferon-induced transmembrane protein 3 [Triplophysa rosa]